MSSGVAPVKELKALAHPLRFRIVEALRTGELNVGEIEQATGIGQPTLSQQLGVLRKAELVGTRKEAKLVFYRLNGPRLTEIGNLLAVEQSAPAAIGNAKGSPSPGAANFAKLS